MRDMMDDRTQTSRYLDIIAAHGAHPRRWPASVRARMRRMARRDPAIAAIMAREAALDALMDADTADKGPLPDGLRARLIASAPLRPASARAWGAGLFSHEWARGAGVAACMGIGILAGYAGAASAFFPAPEDMLLNLALAQPVDPFAGLVEDEA